MENRKKEPTIRTRKNMKLSRIENIPLDELFRLYVHECRIKNLADVAYLLLKHVVHTTIIIVIINQRGDCYAIYIRIGGF